MKCPACNKKMEIVITRENHCTGNVTRYYICPCADCMATLIELVCVRETTAKEREEILSEWVGVVK